MTPILMQDLINQLIKAGRTTIDFTNDDDVAFFAPLLSGKKGKVVKAAKAVKDDKPKKSLNSYMLFCAEARKNVDDFPDKQPKAVSRRLGELWQALDVAQKAQYKNQADQNKRSTSTESVQAESRSVSVDKPKKPLTSYIKFSNAMRDSVKATVSNSQDVSRRLGEMWRALTDEEKAKWKGDTAEPVVEHPVMEEVEDKKDAPVEDKRDESPKKTKKTKKAKDDALVEDKRAESPEKTKKTKKEKKESE